MCAKQVYILNTKDNNIKRIMKISHTSLKSFADAPTELVSLRY